MRPYSFLAAGWGLVPISIFRKDGRAFGRWYVVVSLKLQLPWGGARKEEDASRWEAEIHHTGSKSLLEEWVKSRGFHSCSAGWGEASPRGDAAVKGAGLASCSLREAVAQLMGESGRAVPLLPGDLEQAHSQGKWGLTQCGVRANEWAKQRQMAVAVT